MCVATIQSLLFIIWLKTSTTASKGNDCGTVAGSSHLHVHDVCYRLYNYIDYLFAFEVQTPVAHGGISKQTADRGVGKGQEERHKAVSIGRRSVVNSWAGITH